ncbi:hypothetical protein Hanom_Chr02g00106051 [Helianthus anomalus]
MGYKESQKVLQKSSQDPVSEVQSFLRPVGGSAGDDGSMGAKGVPVNQGALVAQETPYFNSFMGMHDMHGGVDKMAQFTNNCEDGVHQFNISNKADGNVDIRIRLLIIIPGPMRL